MDFLMFFKQPTAPVVIQNSLPDENIYYFENMLLAKPIDSC